MSKRTVYRLQVIPAGLQTVQNFYFYETDFGTCRQRIFAMFPSGAYILEQSGAAKEPPKGLANFTSVLSGEDRKLYELENRPKRTVNDFVHDRGPKLWSFSLPS